MARRPKSDIPVLRTVRAKGHRSRAYRTDVGIRDFDFIIDEPEKLGGENLAPTPMEYVTGALSGCFVVTVEMVAEDQEFNMKELDVDCEGVVDHRGLFGTADVSPIFKRPRWISRSSPMSRRSAILNSRKNRWSAARYTT